MIGTPPVLPGVVRRMQTFQKMPEILVHQAESDDNEPVGPWIPRSVDSDCTELQSLGQRRDEDVRLAARGGCATPACDRRL